MIQCLNSFFVAGPPLPPQDVQVQMGQTPGVLQIRWKPPPLTPTGTSNGANVIGYMVCTKGQKVKLWFFLLSSCHACTTATDLQ